MLTGDPSFYPARTVATLASSSPPPVTASLAARTQQEQGWVIPRAGQQVKSVSKPSFFLQKGRELSGWRPRYHVSFHCCHL